METIENQVRDKLSKSYYLLSQFGLDDQTYVHLSARVPGEDAYYIFPLGLLFSECAPDKLIKVDFQGNIIKGYENSFNTTGYVIHSAIYTERPDINAIFHLHTIAGVAVSAMKKGLLPLSQFAMHFFNKVSYHEYNALALDGVMHGKKMAQDLGSNKAMFLLNHGTITCGEAIEEAFFYTMFLENACKAQVAAMSCTDELVIPDDNVCMQASKDMLAFEQGKVGKRDFDAYCRVTRFPWE